MLSSEEIKKVEEIKAIFDTNELYQTICAAYLNKFERIISKDLIDSITNGDKSFDVITFSNYLANVFIEDENLAKKMHSLYFSNSIRKINPKQYENNLFLKNIKVPVMSYGKWSFNYQTYEPYEGFICDDYLIKDKYYEIPQIGFFDEKYEYPTVFEDGREWMAIKPNEIETMRLPIENAFGDVVVFGLGLGYFTYMVSEKDSVRKIRVIEKSSEVIELFKKYIMPQIRNADKIEIINEDAFVYAEKILKNGCDYAFVDLWHDTLDGIEMYTKMKKLEKGMNTKKVDYWIEKSLLIEIRKKVFDSTYKSANNRTSNLNFENIEFSLDLDNLKKAISNV